MDDAATFLGLDPVKLKAAGAPDTDDTAKLFDWYWRWRVDAAVENGDAERYNTARTQSLNLDTELNELHLAQTNGKYRAVDDMCRKMETVITSFANSLKQLESRLPNLDAHQHIAFRDALNSTMNKCVVAHRETCDKMKAEHSHEES